MPDGTTSNMIWENTTLLTLCDNGAPYGRIDDGALIVQDGLIAWAGPRAELPSPFSGLARRDCGGRYITPGLIDCHTHLVYGGTRIDEFEQRLAGVRYEDIAHAGGGILSTVRATRETPEDQLYKTAATRLKQMIRHGVTTIEIKSGYGLDTESEMKMLRVARRLGQDLPVDVSVTFLGAHALPPEYKDNRQGYIDLICDEMLPRIAEDKLADAVDGYCEKVGFSAAEMDQVFQAATRLGLKVKLHAEQLSNCHGAILAARHKALSADHLEYLDEAGVDALASAGMVAVLLPGAYYFLKETQKPPVGLLRRYNVPMAIATDHNPGTSPALSLPLMMNMACILWGLTPEEALTGVTHHAARALGMADRGRLDPGQKADFVLWDIGHPAELAYQIGGNACAGVIKAGRELDLGD